MRRASADDAAVASEVLAGAFADYPWTRWTVDADRHEERVEALQRLFMERVALPYGEVWLATDVHDVVTSVAMWSRPDAAVPESVLREVDAMRMELEGDRCEMSTRAEAHVAGSRPKEPHYYLGAVGTRRERQRQGFGSAVLGPVLDRAAAEGVDVYLETSSLGNVELYRGLGFVVAAESTIPDGGPRVWSMRRSL